MSNKKKKQNTAESHKPDLLTIPRYAELNQFFDV